MDYQNKKRKCRTCGELCWESNAENVSRKINSEEDYPVKRGNTNARYC